MSVERAQYGDFTRQAALHLTAGAAIVTGEQFSGLTVASAAVTAYADLFDSLYRLAWQLRGGTIERALVPGSERRDQHESVTLDLIEQVGRLAARAYHVRVPRVGAAGQWHRAAVQLRAANDLLATHRTPLGRPRAPDTPDLQDPAVAGPVWRDYAALVLAAASIAEPLAYQARAAGAAASRVRHLPWAGDRLIVASQQLRAGPAVSGTSARTELDDLEVARPATRTGDQLLELSDRLRKMQVEAWRCTGTGSMSLPTLTSLAAVGSILHSAAHRRLTSQEVTDPATLKTIATRGTAWRRAYGSLADLRSIVPVPGGIHRDARAVRRLLSDAAHDARDDRLTAVLVDACRSQSRVADWCGTALTDLWVRGQVYVLGHVLNGDDIGDEHDLVAAKLNDRLTTAPPRTVIAALDDLAIASGSTASRAEYASQSVPRLAMATSPVWMAP